MSREVVCREKDTDIVVDDILCPAAVQPPLTMPCFGSSCEEEESVYYRQLGAWSACTAECDGGVQRRAARCHEIASDAEVDTSVCPPMPPIVQACNEQACPEAYYCTDIQ